MRDLKIYETGETPKVEFDPNNNTLTFVGKILCEDAPDFFEPINEWLNEYEAEAPDSTHLDINLEYFNTSSSKCLLGMLKKFEKLSHDGKKVEVIWHYEMDDDDMEEAGKDLNMMVDVPFKFVAKA